MDIWSVGHGARPLGVLLEMLRAVDVESLADVRLAPGSRRHPHFNARRLRRRSARSVSRTSTFLRSAAAASRAPIHRTAGCGSRRSAVTPTT
jgi:uncharacterized protein (DUF488 family)